MRVNSFQKRSLTSELVECESTGSTPGQKRRNPRSTASTADWMSRQRSPTSPRRWPAGRDPNNLTAEDRTCLVKPSAAPERPSAPFQPPGDAAAVLSCSRATWRPLRAVPVPPGDCRGAASRAGHRFPSAVPRGSRPGSEWFGWRKQQTYSHNTNAGGRRSSRSSHGAQVADQQEQLV